MPGEFFCAATRPPSVYRGNPFLIEVGLAYGGASSTQKVTLEALTEMLAESDARSVRQFLLNDVRWIGRLRRGADYRGGEDGPAANSRRSSARKNSGGCTPR